MKFIKRNRIWIAMLVLGMSLIPSVYAREIDSTVRRVGHARWQKEVLVNPNDLLQREVPEGAASVFFVRQQDNDGLQTSANIAINGRFQVSLQPGNYSQVLSCSGVNRLSADITGHKNNDLLRNAVNYNLDSKQTYFFYVDVDDTTGAASIHSLSKDEAMRLMEKQQMQTHQISRVVPNCEQPPAPVEKVTIELKVLFDTDKSFVKSQYYPEIEQVAEYMKRFPNTSVTLEGHTDSRASDEYNIALSQRRMNAVRDILIRRYGIDANRVHAVGYGESRPAYPNTTPENMHQNRRVVAVFEVADALESK